VIFHNQKTGGIRLDRGNRANLLEESHPGQEGGKSGHLPLPAGKEEKRNRKAASPARKKEKKKKSFSGKGAAFLASCEGKTTTGESVFRQIHEGQQKKKKKGGEPAAFHRGKIINQQKEPYLLKEGSR